MYDSHERDKPDESTAFISSFVTGVSLCRLHQEATRGQIIPPESDETGFTTDQLSFFRDIEPYRDELTRAGLALRQHPWYIQLMIADGSRFAAALDSISIEQATDDFRETLSGLVYDFHNSLLPLMVDQEEGMLRQSFELPSLPLTFRHPAYEAEFILDQEELNALDETLHCAEDILPQLRRLGVDPYAAELYARADIASQEHMLLEYAVLQRFNINEDIAAPWIEEFINEVETYAADSATLENLKLQIVDVLDKLVENSYNDPLVQQGLKTATFGKGLLRRLHLLVERQFYYRDKFKMLGNENE